MLIFDDGAYMIKSTQKNTPIFVAIILILNITCFASEWDDVRERGLEPGKTYDISSGTGFFISPGYIITNEHVVQNCLTISVRGAVDPSPVELIASDKDADLAILKSNNLSSTTASFRRNEGLSVSDRVFVIGYPLEHSNDGQYLLREANVITMDDQVEETKHIEFTAIIEKGNSGGPLIDLAGNVIGIVQAKKNYYYLSANSNEVAHNSTPYQVNGLAIGIKQVEDFLRKNQINYSTSDSYKILNYYQPDTKAKNYVVNIHCVRDKN